MVQIKKSTQRSKHEENAKNRIKKTSFKFVVISKCQHVSVSISVKYIKRFCFYKPVSLVQNLIGVCTILFSKCRSILTGLYPVLLIRCLDQRITFIVLVFIMCLLSVWSLVKKKVATNFSALSKN